MNAPMDLARQEILPHSLDAETRRRMYWIGSARIWKACFRENRQTGTRRTANRQTRSVADRDDGDPPQERPRPWDFPAS
jgi:hypothetical protein